jgi:hypothetical protein
MTSTLAGSDFTSIQARLRPVSANGTNAANPQSRLLPFSEGQHDGQSTRALPFHLEDYIDLVDHTARIVRLGKPGAISKSVPTLVSQLGLTHEQWLALTLDIQSQSLQAIGELSRLECYVESTGRQWLKGQSQLSRLYSLAVA